MCKSWCELIVAIVIIVFSLWQTAWSNWIIIIAAVVLLIHSFTCKSCFAHHRMMGEGSDVKRRKRR